MFGRIWCGVLVAMACCFFAACGSSDSTSTSGTGSSQAATSTEGKRFTVGVSNPLASNPVLANWQKGLEAQAEALGMDVKAVDANFDPNKQLSDIDTLISQDVDAIILTPHDPSALRSALERAKAEGIVVIGWEGLNEAPYDVNFDADDVQASKEAAEYMASMLPKGAKVTAIDGVPQVPILKDRSDGFTQGAEGAGLNIIARQVNLKDSADGARPIVEGWRTKYGSDLGGIWAYNDPSALGAASAVSANFKPIITGMNASEEGIQGVRDGQIVATWDQRSIDAGNGEAWAAHEVLSGKKVPQTVRIAMPRYDKDNLSEWTPPAKLLAGPEKVSLSQKGGSSYLETTPPTGG